MNIDKKIRFIRLVVVSVMIILISIYIKINHIISLDDIINLIKSHGSIGIIIYVLLFSILPTFFVTVTILAIGAGAVFGLFYGSIYTFIGAFINSTITYFISKYLAFDLTNEIATKRYYNIYDKLKRTASGKDGFMFMLILRLLPLIPYTFLNYMSGVVGYNYKIFITSTLLGIIPGMLCYVNVGANSLDGLSPKLMISISILAAFALVSSILAKIFYKNKVL